ncbi:MAG TPA: hypothetical protein PLG59_17250 [bacterium]|nr:hypothetical protein [bacterium]
MTCRFSRSHLGILVSLLGVFCVYLGVDYPLSPGPQDSCTYYYIAQSNIKYLTEFLFSDSEQFNPERCAEQHIVPCAMPVAKPFVFLMQTLYAAILPVGFRFMAIGQALTALLISAALLIIVTLLYRMVREQNLTVPDTFPCAVPFLLLFALSGSQIYYSMEFTTAFINSLAISLTIACYLSYRSRPSLSRSAIFGLSMSVAVSSHLSTVFFLLVFPLLELLDFFLRFRSTSWTTRLSRWAIITLCVPVFPLLTQLVTWIPTLWIEDPSAWKFTAYYGWPYRTYFGQLKSYADAVQEAFDHSMSLVSRFTIIGILAVVLEGPILILSATGWIAALSDCFRKGWNIPCALLVVGPILPLVSYVLARNVFPAPYATTPIGIYFVLLAGYGTVRVFELKTKHFASRMLLLAFPLCVILLQVIHLSPMVRQPGAYLALHDWLEEQGEHRVVVLGRQGLTEAAGIDTYGFEGNQHLQEISETGNPQLGAWGLRPALEWDDPDLPRYLALTDVRWLPDRTYDDKFIQFHQVDLANPTQRFPEFSITYYYAEYYALYAGLRCFFQPSLTEEKARNVKALRDRYERDSLFVYEIPRRTNPGE